MNSLRFYLDVYEEDELEAILEYCKQDEVVANVPKLLTDLLQSQIDKKNKYIYNVKSNMYYPQQYYEFFDYETARKLDSLTRRMQLSKPFYKEDVEWMKKFELPVKPIPFWGDLYEMIRYFKGEIEKPNLICRYEIDFTELEEED